MLGSRGVIEQDQMQHGFGDVIDLRGYDVVGDRPQRQVVNLDVTGDVGLDAGGEVFERLPCQLVDAAPHVEHYAGANRGKADHRGESEQDQQLG